MGPEAEAAGPHHRALRGCRTTASPERSVHSEGRGPSLPGAPSARRTGGHLPSGSTECSPDGGAPPLGEHERGVSCARATPQRVSDLVSRGATPPAASTESSSRGGPPPRRERSVHAERGRTPSIRGLGAPRGRGRIAGGSTRCSRGGGAPPSGVGRVRGMGRREALQPVLLFQLGEQRSRHLILGVRLQVGVHLLLGLLTDVHEGAPVGRHAPELLGGLVGRTPRSRP